MTLKPGLRTKIILIVLGAMLLAMGINAAVFGVLFARQQTEALQSRSQAIAKSLVIQLDRVQALGIGINELRGFEVQCQEVLQAYEGLAYAMVVDEQNTILFHSDPARMGKKLTSPALLTGLHLRDASTYDIQDGTIVAALPVRTLDGREAGHVIVGYPRDLVRHERNILLIASLGVGMGVILLCLLLLYLTLSHYVLNPILSFARTAERIRSGKDHYDVRLPLNGETELDAMMAAFNGLLDEIAHREAQLQITSEAAQAASRAKSEFLAVMSHEIRTPIHAILGMTELLQGTDLNEKQQRYVSRVYDAGGTLLTLVNEVLDFARIEAGQLKILQVPFDLKQTISDKVEIFSELARQKELVLVLVLAEDLPETVLGDPYRLGQILNNLLSNAIKFTETGRIDVCVSSAPGRVCFEVRDTGSGMDAGFLPQLFEPFQQADSSHSRQYGGTGLGLAIVKQLCEAMGGSIRVESALARGSTFWFDLPLATVSTGPTPIEEPRA